MLSQKLQPEAKQGCSLTVQEEAARLDPGAEQQGQMQFPLLYYQRGHEGRMGEQKDLGRSRVRKVETTSRISYN